MKILYIHREIKLVSGGYKCQEANLEMLKRIAGYDNVYIYSRDNSDGGNKWRRNYNRLFTGRYANFTKSDINSIFSIINDKMVNVVFFDGSQMGSIAKKIKVTYPNIKIITFFHNVELLLKTANIKGLAWYQQILAQTDRLNIYIGEKNACKYSDIVLCLNLRDAGQINDIYGRKVDKIIPISLRDNFSSSSLRKHNNKTPIGLMVGSYFAPNVKGLEWFIINVLPHVNMNLIVVGSGMNILNKKYKGNNKIKIFGYVEDLQELYAKADFMVMPIFEGSGMKVKTAEALEYGKTIFAAPEAVVGYNYTDKEIKVCHNAEDFIINVNNFKMTDHWNGFNQSSRELFLKRYSYESLEKEYRSIL